MPSSVSTSQRGKQPTRKPSERSDKRQLNAWDSAFLYLDTPETPMYGGFLHIYAPLRNETPARRFDRLRGHIERSLDASPVFRRRVVRSPFDLDHAWFVDGAAVDLDYHVRRHALPEPGSDRELNDMYARIAVQPMDAERPLWEIHIIDGLDAVDGVPKGGFAMFLKVHHAAVDGKSAAEMTAALHRTTPQRQRLTRMKPHCAVAPPALPGLSGALLGTIERYASLSTLLTRKLIGQLPALSRLLTARLLGGSGSPTKSARDGMSVPLTPFNIAINADRCYTHFSLPLDEIKRLRQHVEGSTVNDVYLSVVGGALRRYLKAHRALPRESLIVGVTVDTRDEGERGKGGNHVALIRLRLRTDEADATRRLQRIAADTARAKASLKRSDKPGAATHKRANLATLIPSPLLWLLGSANRMRITAKFKPLVNLGATNVPGPREVLYLDGARMLDFNGAPPFFHGVALVVNATSYDNALRISVTSCRSAMPDPEFMRQCLLDAYAELKAALLAPKRSRQQASAAPRALPSTERKKKASGLAPARRRRPKTASARAQATA